MESNQAIVETKQKIREKALFIEKKAKVDKSIQKTEMVKVIEGLISEMPKPVHRDVIVKELNRYNVSPTLKEWKFLLEAGGWFVPNLTCPFSDDLRDHKKRLVETSKLIPGLEVPYHFQKSALIYLLKQTHTLRFIARYMPYADFNRVTKAYLLQVSAALIFCDADYTLSLITLIIGLAAEVRRKNPDDDKEQGFVWFDNAINIVLKNRSAVYVRGFKKNPVKWN